MSSRNLDSGSPARPALGFERPLHDGVDLTPELRQRYLDDALARLRVDQQRLLNGSSSAAAGASAEGYNSPNVHEPGFFDALQLGGDGKIDRRQLLRGGIIGLGGLLFMTLTNKIAAQQRAVQAGYRRLIWLQMDGGAAPVDTLNYKPAGGGVQTDLSGVRTRAEGLQFSEGFPILASLADKGVFFRARVASSTDHLSAQQTQQGLDRANKTFLMRHNERTIRTKVVYMETHSPISAFDYRRQAFRVQDCNEIVRTPEGAYPPPRILEPEEGLTPEETLARIEVRSNLLSRLESTRPAISGPPVERAQENRETALRMMRQAARAVDRLDPKLVRRYCGDTEHSTGLSILRARELIRGGMFHAVLIRLADNDGYGGWDLHSKAREGVRHMGPRFDRAVGELIRDQVRGDLEDTLIVIDTEFGRSVGLDDGGGTGRGHALVHAAAMFHPTLRGGAVVGDMNNAGKVVGGERDGVMNDTRFLQVVNEALVVPRERRNFTLREEVPIFTDKE